MAERDRPLPVDAERLVVDPALLLAWVASRATKAPAQVASEDGPRSPLDVDALNWAAWRRREEIALPRAGGQATELIVEFLWL